MTETSTWLARIGLARYADVFEAEEIDLPALRHVTDADLRELGLPMGPRKTILAALDAATAPVAAPASSAPVEEPPRWRQVSVLFCDLVGSSLLPARLGAEDMRGLVHAYRKRLSKVITAHGGWVAEYPGDGIVAYFGFPNAHEDDASRAVFAALQTRPEIAAINAEWEQRIGHAVAVRISVDSGRVIVARAADDPDAPQNDITGEAPVVAARLQELGDPGEILVSHRTFELSRGYFRFEPRGAARLHNVTRPVEVYKVVEPTGNLTPFRAATTFTPFVNRERELDLVLQIWRRVRAGSSDIVAISGEAGIGKSRLINRIRELLATDAHDWVDLQCASLVQQTAFFPVKVGLRSALGPGGEPDDGDLPRRVAVLVRRLIGRTPDAEAARDLLVRFLGPEARDALGGEDITAERRRRQTVQALVRLAAAASRRRPLVICIDDVQWLDPTSRELLEQLFIHLDSCNILIFLTFRPDFDPNWPAAPSILQLKLGRLQAQESRLIVRSMSAERDLPAYVQRQIVERCGGVPLFLEELTKSVGEVARMDGPAFGASEPRYSVPASLQQSIIARLDRLGRHKEIAEIASVLGRSFDRRVLEHLSGRRGADLSSALGELERGGVIYPFGALSSFEFQFKHALVRDAIYESMLSGTRRDVHAAAADALRTVRRDAVARNPEFVAFHYEAAEDWQAAMTAWLDAGVRAIERSETAEAIEHLTRGIGLIARVEQSDASLRIEIQLRTSLASALRAKKGFAADEVIAHLTRARGVCETLGDHDLLIDVLEGQQSFHHVRGQLEVARDLGERLLGFASSQRGDTDHSLRAIRTIDAHRRLGWTLFWMGAPHDARAHFDKGLEIYGTIPGDHRQLIRIYGDHPGIFTHCNLAWACWYLGESDACEAHIDEAMRLVAEADHLLSWTYANSVIATLHVIRLDPERALEVSEATLRSASRTWLPYWIAWAGIQRGWARSQLGDASGGVDEIEHGMAAYCETGAKLVLPVAHGLLADAYLASGRIVPAYRSLLRGLRTSRKLGISFYVPELHRRLGEMQVDRIGRPEEGAETLARAIDSSMAHSAYFFELRARVAAIETARPAGVAASDLDRLAALIGRFGSETPDADIQKARTVLDAAATHRGP